MLKLINLKKAIGIILQKCKKLWDMTKARNNKDASFHCCQLTLFPKYQLMQIAFVNWFPAQATRSIFKLANLRENGVLLHILYDNMTSNIHTDISTLN